MVPERLDSINRSAADGYERVICPGGHRCRSAALGGKRAYT
jgi:hypothetical protein